MNKSSLLFTIVLFLYAHTLWGSPLDSKLEFNSPIQWQQLRLQQNIEEKISRSFAPVLSEKDYIIEVKIDIDPNYTVPNSPKKITKGKQGKKIKYSSDGKTNDDGDYVVFSKFGLEAPAIGEEEIYTETSEAETTQKAIIEVSNHFNIFNYLKGIEITLTFDSNTSSTTKDVLKKIVSGLRFNYNGIVPQIIIRHLELKPVIKQVASPPKSTESAPPKTDIFDFFKFNNTDLALSLIIAALIISFAFIFLKKSQRNKNGVDASAGSEAGEGTSGNPAQEKRASSGTGAGASGKDNNAKENICKSALGVGGGSGSMSDIEDDEMKKEELRKKTEEGLSRFRKALNNHYDQTIITMKKMIKSNKEADGQALKALVDTLTDQELTQIFQALSIEERNTWKNHLDTELNIEQFVRAFHYISARLMEAMMMPTMVKDVEIFDFFLGIPPKEAALVCQEDIELAVILTNMLSTDITTEMFKLLPEETLTTIIEKSMQFTPEDLEAKTPLLKEKIKLLKKKSEKPIFVTRILEMLPLAKPELEPKLYSTLSPFYNEEELTQLALKNYPTSLMSKLPPAVFKFAMNQMKLENQVSFFALIPEQERKVKLDAFAAQGTKAREMLEIEIGMITKNEIMRNKLSRERSQELNNDFIRITRESIAQHLELQTEVIASLESWLGALSTIVPTKDNNAL